MKIAVLLGAFSVGTRPLNFDNIWTNERGLTGTDLAFCRVSQEMLKLGHEVHMFTVQTGKVTSWEGITVHDVSEIRAIDQNNFDAVINFNEPNLFIGMKNPLKILYMMLNDFSFVQPGFDEWTDHYVGVCDQHSDYVSKLSGTEGKWSTVPLGCDPDKYEDKRVPGRVIWCSSADRGLHWLLSKWSAIKEQVPHASLRVFYHFNYIGIEEIEDGSNAHPHVIEMAQRIRYIRHAMRELKDLDVVHVGSVSRERMKEEWNQASVFGFPCDTVAFSEGFSVSTLEAHASFTVPVISSVDCLGGIYKDSGCIVIQEPVKEHLDEFSDNVVRALTDQQFADETIEKSREFAKAHSWKETTKQLESIINERI